MLMKLRDQAQSAGSKILIFIICAVLALFGFGSIDVFSVTDPEAASVGSEEISVGRLDAETQRTVNQLIASGQVDASQIDPLVIRPRILEQLITRSVLSQTAGDLGLATSQQRLVDTLRQDPSFQVDGAFDQDTFVRVLSLNGRTPQGYMDELAENLKVQQMTSALQASHFLPEWEFAAVASVLTQRRDVAYLTFRVEELAKDIELSDDDVRDFYELYSDDYLTEETLNLDVVSYSLDDYLAANPQDISEEELLAAYNAEREAANLGESRRVSHILLAASDDRSIDEAFELARDLRSRIEAGDNFAELAEAYSDDPGSAGSGGDLGLVQRGVFVPEFEQVAWATEQGTLAEPVETEFGVHLIRVDEVRSPEYAPFESVRDSLAERLGRERAITDFEAELVPELDKLAYDVDTLAPIAERLGATVERVDGVTRRSGTGVFEAPAARQAAFTSEVIDEGFNSSVIELPSNRIAVLKLAERFPPEQRPLEEVDDEVRSRLARERAAERAAELADEALAALDAGESTTAIAERTGSQWQVLERAARTMPDTPLSVLQTAFELPVPGEGEKSNAIATLGLGDKAVVTVTAVQDGELTTLPESEQITLRLQSTRQSEQTDLTSFFLTAEDDLGVERADG